MNTPLPEVPLLGGEVRRVAEIDLALSDGGAQVAAFCQIKSDESAVAFAWEADPRVAEADELTAFVGHGPIPGPAEILAEREPQVHRGTSLSLHLPGERCLLRVDFQSIDRLPRRERRLDNFRLWA